MKTLLACWALLVAGTIGFAGSAHAQQLPATAPADWMLSVRYYGTTERPDRDFYHVWVHTAGIHPGIISAVRPKYKGDGSRDLNEPAFHGKLPDEKMAAVYQAARTVILNHTVGSPPAVHVKDGTSVEVTIGSQNRKISAVFDHNCFENSNEFAALRETINNLLPKEFRQ
ncbi:MAG TPA: hypothetical protein VMF30_12800 [Pirellulales bacterium]|nr:hypothetical protein [Pirellulales bacterium]